MWYEHFLERGLLPDPLIRAGIRGQLRARLRQQQRAGDAFRDRFVEQLGQGPIARRTGSANEQHYEVPTDFFLAVLGPRRKYSSGYWNGAGDDLAAAEEAMLALYVERAGLADGQSILDLGCGWGSLSLYLAEKLPDADIVAVSNSATQQRFIVARCEAAGFTNLDVRRADINDFDPARRFDRIVSIEMFEHMSNYRLLLERTSRWLADDGRLFVHHFAHRNLVYPFVSDADDEWMARFFFSGGTMPSSDLLDSFADHMRVLARWGVDGTHYQRTCEAWLQRMDRRKPEIMRLFSNTYGDDEARRRWHFWRVFFMACAELFGFRGGSEWFVVHALLEPQRAPASIAPSHIENRRLSCAS